MKLVQFSRYVAASQICKPHSFHVEGLSQMIEGLIMTLTFVNRHEKHDYIAYDPVWISMSREEENQLATLFPKMAEEPLDWSFAYSTDELDDKTFWHRSECGRRKNINEFYLSIGKLCITCQLDKNCIIVEQDTFLNPNSVLSCHNEAEITSLVHWMIDSLLHEYSERVEKGAQFYYRDKSVPVEFQFSYMPYAEFVKYNKGEDSSPNYLINELTREEINQFQIVGPQLSGEKSHGIPLCKSTYLDLVKEAYIAVGFNVEGLSAIESYKRFADGRDGGLLALEDNDESAFLDWFNSTLWQGCHPFEIIRGYRSSSRVALLPVHQDSGFTFTLFAGDDLYRAAPTVKIALRLVKLHVPFGMNQAVRYLKVLNGEAMVGILPIGSDYISPHFFPQTAQGNIEIVAIEYVETIKTLNIPSHLISRYPISALFK